MMLPKKNRLKRGFSGLLAKGEKKKGPYCMIIYMKTSQNNPRFGFIVTKKIGNAVMRNKVKRMLKHIIKEHLSRIPKNLSVIVIASPFVADWKQVDAQDLSHSLFDMLTTV